MSSIKRQYFICQFLLYLLVFPLMQGQIQTERKTINLQPNEQVTLDLDQYYSFAATSFTMNTNPNTHQMISLYKYGDQDTKTTTDIYPLASFEETLTSKYLIGYNFIDGDDLRVYFYQIYLDSSSNSLKRQVLATSRDFSYYEGITSASFYSSFEGFLSVGSEVFNFQYRASQKRLSFQDIEDINMIGSFLTLSHDEFKYILCVESLNNKLYISLIQIDSSYNSKSLQHIQIHPQGVLQVLHSTDKFLSLYDSLTRIMTAVSIDTSSSTIIRNDLQLSENLVELSPINFQKIKDLFIVTFQSLDQNDSPGGYFAKMKYYQNINGGSLVLVDFVHTQFRLSQTSPLFINENTFIFHSDEKYINVVNYETMQISYAHQLESSCVFYSEEYIGTQILLLISKKDNNGNEVYYSQGLTLQKPQIILKGSDESPIVISIKKSHSEFILNLEITINITQKLITTFNQQLINSSNYITAVMNDHYYLEIEKYITGSNLKPQLIMNQTGSSPSIKNLQINQIVPLKSSFEFDTTNYKSIHQTDGYITSIFMRQAKENSYFITAAISPIIDASLNFELTLFSSPQQFSSMIGKIDNEGSFILQPDLNTVSKAIYILSLFNHELYFQKIDITCKETNFTFSSDHSIGVLFVLCGSQITQYSYNSFNTPSPQLLVTSTKTLNQDFASYNELICISGKLFISNSSSIIAYNYIANVFIGNAIQIPVLQDGKQQRVILFSSTFVIIVVNNPIKIIAQYSYNSFIQNESPVFLRNLYIDDQNAINTNLNFIPKRGTNEYLFAGTTVQDQYVIYRINNCNSQNQFYATTIIKNDKQNIPIISSDSICVLSSKSSCSQILKTASVSYQINIEQSLFQSRLVFPASFTLSISGQNQIYDLQIVRNAHTQYGQINQQDDYIQSIRTEIQDHDFSDGTTFYFKDNLLYNACILGWESLQPYYTIKNKVTTVKNNEYRGDIFTILYNVQVKIQSSSIEIGNLLTIRDDDFSICTIVDDQESLINDVANSKLSIDVYAVCYTWLFYLNINFTYDKNNKYIKASLNSKKKVVVEDMDIYYHATWSRLITIENKKMLYDPLYSTWYLIQNSTNDNKRPEIKQYSNPISSYLSYNVINSLNNQKIRLQFYRNGDIYLINATNKSNYIYSTLNLKDMLRDLKYSIDDFDFVKIIYQFADNQFRIQFAYSFIYEIKFGLDKNNLLTIFSVGLFYYKDAFSTLVGGISNSKYTLLLGRDSDDQLLNIALYKAANNQPGYNLIGSSTIVDQMNNRFIISNMEEVSDSKFIICFYQSFYITVSISDDVGIVMNSRKSDFNNESITIYPTLLNDHQHWVRFYVQEQLPIDPIESDSLKLIFSFMTFTAIQLFIFI